tara:strand:+ start:121471 stop:122373 length:903 start_codon:yes stop_codon:yes gene_type:complete
VLNPNLWRGQQQAFDWQGHRISYQDQGDGPVLLLLHGLPGSNWDWHLLWTMLCGQFRLIAPDFLGCGDSDKPLAYDYRLADQADMLQALLSELNISGYHIIAHDYGAAVAWQLTSQSVPPASAADQSSPHSSPVALSMSWLAPRIAGDHDGFLWRERWLSGPSGQLLQGLMTAGLFGRYLEKLTGPYVPLSRQRLQDSWELLCAHQGLQVLPLLLNYRYELPQRREWRHYQPPLPLQIIRGSFDPVSRSLPQIPGVQYTDIACGHFPQLEDAEQLADVLLGFHSLAQPPCAALFSNLKTR